MNLVKDLKSDITQKVINPVITKISAYQTDLDCVGGEYRMAMGKVISAAQSTIVAIETDQGITGYGEVCPLGSNYLPAYAKGVIPGLSELASQLIGQNPLDLGVLNQTMDSLMKGHNYVKSPIDVACWDILGKYSGVPVYTLLGGKYQDKLPLYFSISSAPVADMVDACEAARAEGYKQFQIKCDGNVDEDIERVRAVCATRQPGEIFIADANQGWAQHETVKLVHALKDVSVYIEQPCADLEGCVNIRQMTPHPIKLDESIDSLEALLLAIKYRAMDVVCLKVSKVGGLTKAKQIRDLCAAQGLSMTVEDSWGSDIVTTTLSHLAASTPVKAMLNCSDLNRYMHGHVAHGAPKAENGYLNTTSAPGLGIEPDWDVLGDPVFEYGG
ncbi:mandelate racemase/muconate lactonizing enzyme family protein [Curvivirga aplysinae]|uniref:mandelate racemase/muconate lactonizing enzyme family protein n=1 Tax=Curvivirga aplysinae TaxID=2529852 RepID=UPI0012BD1E73|nr:mandelate racemase/muconate lactonizing enzyme family protein [Curvivirga aplysinae]MTI09857.1 mandelate racemase [Curvivirga aplysinae]